MVGTRLAVLSCQASSVISCVSFGQAFTQTPFPPPVPPSVNQRLASALSLVLNPLASFNQGHSLHNIQYNYSPVCQVSLREMNCIPI